MYQVSSHPGKQDLISERKQMKKQNTIPCWAADSRTTQTMGSEALSRSGHFMEAAPTVCHDGSDLQPTLVSAPSFLQAERPTPKEGQPPRVTLLESAVGKTHTDVPKLATQVSSLVNFRN